MTKRMEIFTYIRKLGCDPANAQQMMEVFLLVTIVHYQAGGGQSDDEILQGAEFRNLARRLLPWLTEAQIAVLADHSGTVSALCGIIFQEENEGKLAELCRLCTPWLFANFDRYLEQFEADKLGRQLAALTTLLKTGGDVSCLEGKKMQVSEEQAKACREAVWGDIVITRRPIRIPGTVQTVLNAYRRRSITEHKLYEDLLQVKQYRIHLGKALNPWAMLQQIQGRNIETGVTAEETAFVTAFSELKTAKPSDVIRAASYPVSRNDSAMECDFLYWDFRHDADDYTATLIVNPSPDMISEWQAREGENVAFAVPDKTIALLYRTEFSSNGKKFLAFGDIPKCRNVTALLMTARDLPLETVRQLVHDSLQVCKYGARFSMLLPATAFMGKDAIQQVMSDAGGIPEQLLLLPAKVTNSRPGKKALVHGEMLPGTPMEEIQAYRAKPGRIGKRELHFTVEKDCQMLPIRQFFSGEETLIQLYQKTKQRQREMAEQTAVPRMQAEMLMFSNEIPIYYTVAHKGEYLSPKAYYRAGGSRHGAMLTDRIERGLRGRSRDEIMIKLAEVPFYEEAENVILADLNAVYPGEAKKTLSLKTLWYLYRSALSHKRDYQEKLARTLFCGTGQALAALHPVVAGEADYIDAMEQCAPEAGVAEWRQLQLLLEILVKERLIPVNPVDGILPRIAHRASAKMMEVRNSLSKKTLTLQEETAILRWICCLPGKSESDSHISGYEADSMRLYCAIRLLTGLAPREVCGLEWGDLIRIPHTDGWQLQIVRFVAEDGSMIGDAQRPEKYRRLPLCTLLSTMLLKRRIYLSDHQNRIPGDSEPIILKNEAKIAQHCSLRSAHRMDCQALQAAAIPEQKVWLPDSTGVLVENDLNHYGGDIFASNFRYKAKHVCRMTMGAIHYCAGIKAPSTYAAHYCDYGNDFMQYALGKELDRWTSAFLSDERRTVHHSWVLGQTEQQISLPPYRSNCTVAEIQVTKTGQKAETLHVEFACQHGWQAEFVFYDSEETHETDR